MRFSETLIQQSKEAWEHHTGKALTLEETKEGLRNLVGFAQALHEANTTDAEMEKMTSDGSQTRSKT